MADYLPVNSDASAITLTASGAITGGGLVCASTAAGYCIHTNATTQRAIGVACHDAPDGGRVSIWLLPGFVHEVSAVNSAACTPGLIAVPGATAGRVDVQASLAVASPGTAIGVFVNSTTGTSDGKAKARFLGL